MAVVKHMVRPVPTENTEDSHELGGTLGMTIGGVAGGIAAGVAAGAALGGVAGPAGAVAGAAIGGAVGGALGENIAREVNPTLEEKYWEENYRTRPYVTQSDYEVYRPAYRYGIDAYQQYKGQAFDEIEPSLRTNWLSARGKSTMEWEDAREASRDAYERARKTPADR